MVNDPRLADLEARIKACMAKHGFSDDALFLVDLDIKLRGKGFESAADALDGFKKYLAISKSL